MKNIPNILTLLRVLAIPLLVATILSTSKNLNILAFIFFVTASLTDYFDGFFARKMSIESDFGKMLDPIADKLLIICTLIALMINETIVGISLIPAFIIISREIFISGLREYYSSKENKIKINVSFLGKLKTATQMLSLALLILSLAFGGNQFNIFFFGIAILWFAMILTVISGYQYFTKVYN
tara:strand:+ start:1964 stop:2512 length:549 start_codon:yes stop_codon:yes gene_type:complete